MAEFKHRFLVEMRTGQDRRQIDADQFVERDDWLIFYRHPPQGGTQEHWRVCIGDVVSMSIDA